MKYNIEHWRGILVEAGYREFPVRNSLSHRAQFAFQRRFRDGLGTRYFINVWVYEPIVFPNGNTSGGSCMVELNINEPHQSYEQHGICDLSPSSIQSWETKCRLFFEVMGCCYYEAYPDVATPTAHEKMEALEWAKAHICPPLLEPAP